MKLRHVKTIPCQLVSFVTILHYKWFIGARYTEKIIAEINTICSTWHMFIQFFSSYVAEKQALNSSLKYVKFFFPWIKIRTILVTRCG